MEIEVLTRKSSRKEVIQASAEFYAKKLNILKSKYKVYICMDPSLAKESEANGMCAKTGAKEITIALYSRLPASKLFVTLAHEMVHAKQMMRGQYRIEVGPRNKTTHYWMGKPVKKSYIERPWEIEAFQREGVLLRHLSDVVEKNMKKGKKRS
jgi:hypothetical protein